jgi:hypothetical protein
MWTVARQLQLGEFLGVDGGSPAFVDIGTRTTPFARSGQPLEPVTESEAVTPDLALRVELGQAIESLIDQMVSTATTATMAKTELRSRYPLPATIEASGASLLAACAGRVLDGVALSQDLADGHPPSLDATTDAALKPVFLAFTAWVTDVVGLIGTSAPTNWGASTLLHFFDHDSAGRQTGDVCRRAEPRRRTRLVFIRSLASGKFGKFSAVSDAERFANSRSVPRDAQRSLLGLRIKQDGVR